MGDLPFKHHLKNIFMSFWFRSVDHGLFISPFSLIICLLVRSVTPVHFTCNKMYGRKPGGRVGPAYYLGQVIVKFEGMLKSASYLEVLILLRLDNQTEMTQAELECVKPKLFSLFKTSREKIERKKNEFIKKRERHPNTAK